MTYSVRVVTDAAELDGMRTEWLDLLGRSDANAVMLTPMWLLPWWRRWGDDEGRQLRVVLFHEGAQLVGLAPILRRRFWHRGLVPLRRLEPLGTGERAGEQVCSDYLNVLAARGAESFVAESLAEALLDRRLGAWDEFLVPSINGASAMPGLLCQALGCRGVRADVTTVDAAPYAALPATWEAYLKGQSSSRRYLINHSIRKFEEWAGRDLRLHSAKNANDIAEGLRVLHALHGERWRADGQAGVFASRRFVQFHEAVMHEMLEAGALDLTWLTVAGDPIAVQYNLVWDNKVVTYQSGRKMDVPKNIRPGLVLHVYAIRRAVECGRREYDFLAGVSRYKSELANATRPIVSFRAVRPGLAETSCRALELAVGCAKTVRDWCRHAHRPPSSGVSSPSVAHGPTNVPPPVALPVTRGET